MTDIDTSLQFIGSLAIRIHDGWEAYRNAEFNSVEQAEALLRVRIAERMRDESIAERRTEGDVT